MNMRLEKQIDFIAESDDLKTVLRKTSPIHDKRKENTAEHSWQVAIAAMALAEHANEPIDIFRVVKMLLLHDFGEIDAGDTFHYSKVPNSEQCEREAQGAERIFNFLPQEQKEEWLSLWKEFEARETPDARFAAAMDRMVPMILNFRSNGGTWKEFGIVASQVIERNKHIKEGSDSLWTYALQLIEKSTAKGFFADAPS
jgi:putative hydrolases of HD superfamily